ncbi:DUF6177 family protein [Kribbella sp. NPDC051952]|uniref:DUF6177 family protein n=1 Tax=Kribbella sp. NPDC051952 TaxID=3154851 RepID=UPI00344705E8
MTDMLDFVAGADRITEKAIVMMQDREVVGLSSWLLDAAITAERSQRVLQLVTPRTTRVTHAVRTQLLAPGTGGCWVVNGNDSGPSYDGLSGEPLVWDGNLFVPTGDEENPKPTPDYLQEQDGIHASLQLVARVRYPAAEGTIVGGAAEFLLRELAGGPPAGWGTEEPVSQPWDTAELTHFCRRWVPRSTMLTLTGPDGRHGTRPANGVIEIVNRPAGLEESVTLAIGCPGLEAPLPQAIFPVVRQLADEFDLVSMFVLGAGTAADTCTLPRFTGIQDPIALVIGADGRAAMGPEADKAIAAGAATSIGHDAGLWFPIGTGYSEPDWQTFALTMRRITIATAHHSANPAPPPKTFTMPT